MQTIIFIHNVQAAGTLQPVHGEKMHRFIIHAHQLCQAGRLLGSDVIGMELRTQGSETSILQICGELSHATKRAVYEENQELVKPITLFISFVCFSVCGNMKVYCKKFVPEETRKHRVNEHIKRLELQLGLK